MKIIEKDILTVETGIIFHCCNAQCAMNSGIAKSIREKWNNVYEEYLKNCRIYDNDFQRLGRYSLVKVSDDLFVVNMIAQLNYGYDGKKYVDYCAIKEVFNKLSSPKFNYYYFPYLMCCDRAGGDWNIVSRMIEHYFPNAIICKLP